MLEQFADNFVEVPPLDTSVEDFWLRNAVESSQPQQFLDGLTTVAFV